MDGVFVVFPFVEMENVKQMTYTLGLRGTAVEARGEHFYVSELVEPQLSQELEPTERREILGRIGADVFALAVERSHGKPAVEALGFVAALVAEFPNAVLVDDFGNIFCANDILATWKRSPMSGIFGLS